MFGAMTILSGGCTTQEPAYLIIVVEGQELSDAEVFIDDQSVGVLTQTIITADGKIYIDGVLAARGRRDDNAERNDRVSGCSSTLSLTSGKHAIILLGKKTQPLTVVAHIMPGHHMLTFFSDKNLVTWNGKHFTIGPERKVIISSE
jgi:hypothetical protein